MDTATKQPDFLGEVEAYLSAQAIAPRRLGLEAIGDPNFVRELRKGRKVQPRTILKVRQFMAGQDAAQ